MILHGTYLEEGTTRFVAWAEVAGKRQRCYVPMSCKLSSLLPDLKGASVLLEQTKKACALVAVKLRGRWIGLSGLQANRLLQQHYSDHLLSSEETVEGYKFDLYEADQKIGYEVKSVIGLTSCLKYPQIPSERALKQLSKLAGILKAGIRVKYVFVSLGPFVKAIEIASCSKLYAPLKRLVSKGLEIEGWRLVSWRGQERLRPLEVSFEERERKQFQNESRAKKKYHDGNTKDRDSLGGRRTARRAAGNSQAPDGIGKTPTALKLTSRRSK